MKEISGSTDGVFEDITREKYYTVEIDNVENMCYISSSEGCDGDSTLVLTVPELCDIVHVEGNDIQLVIRNKVSIHCCCFLLCSVH